MSRLMQMPGLYLRGSIATQTMSTLTPKQVLEIEKIVQEVGGDYALAPDKHEFIKQLGATIGGDYKSNKEAAAQEFYIALWRATVYLLHHRSYEYICTLCGASEHNKIIFDRTTPICPHCNQTFHNDQTATYKSNKKKHWLCDENDNIIVEAKTKTALSKNVKSPLKVAWGAQKIEDPHKIISDKTQRSKWYSTWIWNYFRQILLENTIKTHDKQQVEISGPADYIAYCVILNDLKLHKNKHQVSESGKEYTICTNILAIPPEFSYRLSAIVKEYSNYNINFTIKNNYIIIEKHKNAEIVSTCIDTNQVVSNLSMDTPSDADSNESNWSDAIDFNSGATYDGNLNSYISDEAMSRIRNELRDVKLQYAFDIFSQSGIGWHKYSDTCGNEQVRKSTMAKFLEVTTKQIDHYKEMIAAQCALHGLCG